MASMVFKARKGDTRGKQKSLKGKREEKRSLGKPTGMQELNIKLDLQARR